MKKRFILIFLAATLLCGCTKAEPQSDPIHIADLTTSATEAVKSSETTTEQTSAPKTEVSTTSETSATTITTEATEPQSVEASTSAEAVTAAPETSATTAATTVTTRATTPSTTGDGVDKYVNLVFAGDNLIHSSIYKQAKIRGYGESYDFTEAYKLVKSYIEDADYAVLNQETLVNNLYEPSNYPTFSTPTDLGDQMIELGFDAFSIANNHVFDMGTSGLLNSLDYWDTKNVPVYGAYRNDEDMNNIRTAEVNGVTFAFVAFTEHTNGISIPASSDIRVILLSNEALMKQQIEAADAIADVVIVSVHFGVEVINDITEQQYDLSQKFADWGADLIIGTQPHTIQSMEYLDKADGGKAFVFYCLGNFISSMNIPKSMVEMLGDVTLKKDGVTGEITIEEVKAIPLICQYNSSHWNVQIIPFKDYTDEDGYNHGVNKYGEFTKAYAKKLIEKIIPKEFLSIE